jgi:hypothetical protein
MASIVYYSNFCEPSKKLLQLIAKTKQRQDMHFLCVDTRFKSPKGEILLQVGAQQVALPSSITRVPALFFTDNGRTLFGDDIYSFLAPKEEAITRVETAGNMEPECFSSGMMAMSDSFSYWDQGAEDLTATGGGGLRQMHNFVTVDQQFSIPTPDEKWEPDKIGKNGSKTLEEYKAEREKAVVMPPPRI